MRKTKKTLSTSLIALSCFGCADDSKGEAISTTEHSTTITSKSLQQERQTEVDAFYLERSEGWNIVETRITESGQVVDYVTIETLYPENPNAPLEEPPPPLPTFTYDEDEIGTGLSEGEDWSYSEFHNNPDLVAPEGTLPVIRPSFERYIEGHVPENIDTLAKYTQWKPTPLPSGVANNRLYVDYSDYKDPLHRYGIQATSAYINTHKYGDPQKNEFSLIQTAIIGPQIRETIEAGLQVSDVLYGDNNLHFFIFFTTNSHGDYGNHIQSYNKDYKGFIQYKYAPFPPGAKISNVSEINAESGFQKVCKIKLQWHKDNWWIYGCTGWLGYYPTSRSKSVNIFNKIPFNDIRYSAERAAWYGEVYSEKQNWTKFNMGTGNTITSGQFGSDLYIRGIYTKKYKTHTNEKPNWYNFGDINQLPFISNSACYNGTEIKTHWDSRWRRHFFIGGPGQNTNCL